MAGESANPKFTVTRPVSRTGASPLKWNRWRYSQYCGENDGLYLVRWGRRCGSVHLLTMVLLGVGLGTVVFLSGRRVEFAGGRAVAALVVCVAVSTVGVLALRRLGTSLWASEWKSTGRRARVRDPRYGEWHDVPINAIHNGKKYYEFAVCEYSNGSIYGLYLPDPRHARAAERKLRRRKKNAKIREAK